MPLVAGQSLSFYEILGPLGAGGMGEVYRARDTRLEREVAIKVLPEELSGDTDRRRRFEREAKTLASLNHPNIAGIHGVDHDGDVFFLALELVPGRDLAEIVANGPIPIAEAIDICRQIAEGLEAAHEAGVVHRDLKPGNVRITPDDTVKLLDFGLAKPARRGPAGNVSGARPDSVELSEEGLVLGTPTYMSPEQARGKPVCRRTDIWAFGCVLYECLTGSRAYFGRDSAEILAAVLEHDWNRDALPSATPAHVRELLERCLTKDPRQRLRDIGEARIALERGEAPAPRERRPARKLVWFAILVALAVGALAGSWLSPVAESHPFVHRPLTDRAGIEETPAVSPDEQKLAFVARVDGKRQVFVRWITKHGSPTAITSGEREHSFPRWVDDTTLMYYRHPRGADDEGSLWETLILSSSGPQRICAAQGEADVSPIDGKIATFRADEENSWLLVIDRASKRAEVVGRLPGTRYTTPRWSPDGRKIAYQQWVNLATSEVSVFDLDTRKPQLIVRAGATRGLAWLPDGSGFVYASSEGSTLVYPPTFTLRTVGMDGRRDAALAHADVGYASWVEPEVTRSGHVVASRIQLESDVYRYPIDGSPADNVRNSKRITWQTASVQTPTVSRDGTQVAYLSNSGGHANLWTVRVDGKGAPRQLTNEQDPLLIFGAPQWSPADDQIVHWRSRKGEQAELWLINSDGTDYRKLVDVGGGACWTSDGQWIYFIHAVGLMTGNPSTHKIRLSDGEQQLVREGASGMVVNSDETAGYFTPSTARQGEVWKVAPIKTGTPRLLFTAPDSRIPLWPHQVTLSPDDEWLAVPLRDEGTTNLWLIPTKGGEPKQITDFGRRSTTIGRQVAWSPDSKFIYAALMETDADIVLIEDAISRE